MLENIEFGTTYEKLRKLWKGDRSVLYKILPEEPGKHQPRVSFADMVEMLTSKPRRYYSFVVEADDYYICSVDRAGLIASYMRQSYVRSIALSIESGGLYHFISGTSPWGMEDTTVETFATEAELLGEKRMMVVDAACLDVQAMEVLDLMKDARYLLEEDGVERLVLRCGSESSPIEVTSPVSEVREFIETAIENLDEYGGFQELVFEYSDGKKDVIPWEE